MNFRQVLFGASASQRLMPAVKGDKLSRPKPANDTPQGPADKIELSSGQPSSLRKTVCGVLGTAGLVASAGMLVTGMVASAPLLGLGLLIGGLGLLTQAFPGGSENSEWSPSGSLPLNGGAPLFEVNGQRFTAAGEGVFDMGRGISMTPSGTLISY